MRKTIDPEIVTLAEECGGDPEAILSIFQSMQTKHGGLTDAAIADVARALKIPTHRAWGVATFYSMLSVSPRAQPVIRVCDGPACWLRGATQVHTSVEAAAGSQYVVERTSCLGLCDRAPAALVDERQVGPVDPDRVDANALIAQPMPQYIEPRPGEKRVLLADAGKIDPDSIESALAAPRGAYRGLKAALGRPPESVVSEAEASGMLGRGGAGFPVGRKWRTVFNETRSPKYVVCNADESEPLVFKDRVLIDTNPHQLLEGMALAGYAVGAGEGFIYIRGEYEPQAARLERAIRQAEEHGWLGNNIQGTGFSFHLHIHRGAGAYICGEETALLESLEGRRGEPRIRPPFPATHGYHGLPTIVNNVETFSSIPHVIVNGAAWYRTVGATHESPRQTTTPGTKLYTLLGHVNRPGLFEAPFGLTLRQIIGDFGGGMKPGSTFNFALTGGAAGAIVPLSLFDVPIDYTSGAKGVSLGAGAFLICDQTVSPVAMLRELLRFFEVESCGKCTPCREGTRQAREILDRMAAGKAQADGVQALAQWADVLQVASFCGLGQSVAIPMKSALKHFAKAFGLERY